MEVMVSQLVGKLVALVGLLATLASGYSVNKFSFLMPNVRPTVVSSACLRRHLAAWHCRVGAPAVMLAASPAPARPAPAPWRLAGS